MKKFALTTQPVLAAVCVVASLFLLSGCITSEKPLSAPGFLDEKATGTWKRIAPGNETPGDLIVTVKKDGWYTLEERDHPEKGPEKITTHRAFPTQGKRYNYVNMIHPEPKPGVKEPKVASDFDDRYVLMRYSINDKKLTVNAVDYTSLKAEVDAKRLIGSAWETTWASNARIDDDPKKLLELFEGKDGDRFFSGEPLIYERKAP